MTYVYLRPSPGQEVSHVLGILHNHCDTMPPQHVEETKSCLGGGDREGQEILYDGLLYDVTSWIKHHPGGNIIKFYTQPGEDATIPIQQFHNRSMDRVLKIMGRLPKRKVVQAGE